MTDVTSGKVHQQLTEIESRADKLRKNSSGRLEKGMETVEKQIEEIKSHLPKDDGSTLNQNQIEGIEKEVKTIQNEVSSLLLDYSAYGTLQELRKELEQFKEILDKARKS